MRTIVSILTTFLVTLACLVCYTSAKCSMEPTMVVKPKNRNDLDRYKLDIPGNPQFFSPNEQYNISIKINPKYQNTQHRFKHFIVAVEAEADEHGNPGKLETGYDRLSKFSDRCPNMIVEANTLPKFQVNFFWRAPASGCVIIKATVVESKEEWYSEDAELSKKLCEDKGDNGNIQPPVLTYCCACEEAKYEMAFEGTWMRNTHPKDFPEDKWSTKFSDVVGSSHKYGAGFWKAGEIASDGLAELATNGTTKTLESELSRKNENIRTIIKARGLHYPYLTHSTYAMFRVDSDNHLVSLVAKFSPSPDWFVGVHDMELCRFDCTWEDSKTLNLYPYDAGIDDGITYTSPPDRSPQRQQIRTIKSNSPNDIRSPFYDETGASIKPIAKLHLIRKKLYEKECPTRTESQVEDPQCATTSWSEWSPCSEACGVGVKYRMRDLLERWKKKICSHIKLVESTECRAECTEQEEKSENGEDNASGDVENYSNGHDEMCKVSDWGFWSECSVRCGRGHKVRDRLLVDERNTDFCKESVTLQETEDCFEDGYCPENQHDMSDCQWNEWEPCNATCMSDKQGIVEGWRWRFSTPPTAANYEDDDDDHDDNDNGPKCPINEVVRCSVSCSERRFAFTPESSILSQEPVGSVINCRVTPWSSWSECRPSSGEKCGRGWRIQTRTIIQHPENGGTACPNKLRKKQSCELPCDEEQPSSVQTSTNECVMGNWTKWTACNKNCGNAEQMRTRNIEYQPPGVTCTQHRIEWRKCRLPIECDQHGNPNFM